MDTGKDLERKIRDLAKEISAGYEATRKARAAQHSKPKRKK